MERMKGMLSLRKNMASLVFCLFALLLPVVSYAQPTEIPFASLSDDDQQEVVNLTFSAEEAFGEGDYETALSYIQKAMEKCTDYDQAEYDMARIYQEMDRCYDAYYHFERLNNREIKDSELRKAASKHFKTVKKQCSDAVDFQITCQTPGAMLSIVGFSNDDIPCPLYTKVKQGAAYSLTVKKEGYFDVKDSIFVDSDSYIRDIPPLKAIASVGTLSVVCPKGSKKFYLTNQSTGEVIDKPCPWEGKIDSGTYKIKLENQDDSTSQEVVVGAEGSTAFKFAVETDSACVCSSVSRASNTAFPVLSTILAAMSIVFVGMRRRKEN